MTSAVSDACREASAVAGELEAGKAVRTDSVSSTGVASRRRHGDRPAIAVRCMARSSPRCATKANFIYWQQLGTLACYVLLRIEGTSTYWLAVLPHRVAADGLIAVEVCGAFPQLWRSAHQECASKLKMGGGHGQISSEQQRYHQKRLGDGRSGSRKTRGQ